MTAHALMGRATQDHGKVVLIGTATISPDMVIVKRVAHNRVAHNRAAHDRAAHDRAVSTKTEIATTDLVAVVLAKEDSIKGCGLPTVTIAQEQVAPAREVSIATINRVMVTVKKGAHDRVGLTGMISLVMATAKKAVHVRRATRVPLAIGTTEHANPM